MHKQPVAPIGRLSFLVFFHIYQMKSFIASAVTVTLHAVGFALGCGFWGGIGYLLGCAFGAPITTALCGVAYQTAAYFALHKEMSASLERSQSRFLVILDRISA